MERDAQLKFIELKNNLNTNNNKINLENYELISKESNYYINNLFN